MIQVGTRIYYDKQTGNVILDIPEQVHYGERLKQTIDRDIASFSVLSERNRATFDVVELPYGAHAQDFAQSNGYRVNPSTKAIEFSYPNPNEPTEPPVFVQPITEQITELKNSQADLWELVLFGGV